MTAGDLALRAGSIERTGARAVAESLSAVTALARVPVIDDHLHCHLASPNAGCTSPRRFVPPGAGDRVRGRPKAAVEHHATVAAVSLPQPHVQYLSDC